MTDTVHQTPELVTYDGLPASKGGAHSLRTRRAASGLETFERFLAACVVEHAPVEWRLVVIHAARPDEVSPFEAAIAERLGGRSARKTVIDSWSVRDEQFAAALDLFDVKRNPALKAPAHLRPTLTGSVTGLAKDPGAGAPYAGISPAECGDFAVDGYGARLGGSTARVSLGQASAKLSLQLSLPGDDRLAVAARHVQEHLPFALSEKHWKRWRLAANGEYRDRREPSPLVVP